MESTREVTTVERWLVAMKRVRKAATFSTEVNNCMTSGRAR